MTERRSEPGEALLHRAVAEVAGAGGELPHRRGPAALWARPEQDGVAYASQARRHAGDGSDEEMQRRNTCTLGGFVPPFNRQMARFALLRAGRFRGVTDLEGPLDYRLVDDRRSWIYPSGEWSTLMVRRRLKHVDLRATSTLRSEALRGRLADLVRERQALRDRGAAAFVLEQNRLAIVQAQLELARTLVSEHAEAVA
jgi:hypothetical protein